MALIVDPDDLNQGVEVVIDTSTLTITLCTQGNLSTDGVTMQALYSFLKEEWKDDANLIKFDFPMISITNEQFELINSWDFFNQGTKDLVREGGWALKDAGGTSQEEYMNVTTLGSFNDANNDLAYYLQVSGGTPTDFVLTGPVNQAVKIYGDGTHGNFDYRGFFIVYLREQGKLYDSYDLNTEQNITALTYKKYAMPLSNDTDLKITNLDNVITSAHPYTGMSISWYSSGQERTIGGTPYYFSIIIDGNEGTAEQIYEFVQYQLRQPTDIDALSGSHRGDITDDLLLFVGDTLRTLFTADSGVYIDNFQTVDTNRLEFTDDANVVRTFPFVAAGTIQFNDNLQNSSDAKYVLFFTDANGNQFGTSSAIIVDDNNGSDITDLLSGRSSVSFDFDYDNNNQGGRTSGTNAEITLVALGTDTAQYVKATGTITRSTQNSYSLVSALERNYSNP